MTPGPFDEIGQEIAELPRPRAVRMSTHGKTMAVIISTALIMSVGGYGVASNSGPSSFPVYAMFVLIILVFMVVIAIVVARQKQLLAEGEMGMARVVDHALAHNRPNIRYELTTPLGEHLSGGAQDKTKKLSVGMNVPVFYDPENPKKQLALCAFFYEVVLRE